MTADAARICQKVAHRQRLRIVYHDEVVLVTERLRIGAGHAFIQLAHLGREVEGGALQPVVKTFGDTEVLGRRGDDLPLAGQAGVCHEGCKGVEDLRHAAAEGGGVHMQYAAAAQRLRQLADLVRQLAGHDAAIVCEELVTDIDVAHVSSFPPL